MHRKAGLLIALLMVALLGCTVACAEESYYVELPSKGITSSMKITVDVPGENPDIPGVNPITGEPWQGSYYPILIQLDSHPDALPHWGIASADLVYEMPLQKDGSTRSLAVFMGTMPSFAGPIRSARVPMASLREMWDGAWAFYGWQNTTVKADRLKVDVEDWVHELHPEAIAPGGGKWKFNFPPPGAMAVSYTHLRAHET